MPLTAWSFPIKGGVVSEAVRGSFKADDKWLLSHLDVPSGIESPAILKELRDRLGDVP